MAITFVIIIIFVLFFAASKLMSKVLSWFSNVHTLSDQRNFMAVGYLVYHSTVIFQIPFAEYKNKIGITVKKIRANLHYLESTTLKWIFEGNCKVWLF